jgi:hypothetical protein
MVAPAFSAGSRGNIVTDHRASSAVIDAPSQRASRSLPIAVRIVGGILLIAHGLIHLMGTAVLWHIAEVGDLHYGGVVPATPAWIATLAGGEWLVAAVVFVAAGVVLMMGRRGWLWLTLGAVILSLPAVIMNAQFAAAGIVLDVLLVLAVAAAQLWRTRRSAGR